VKAVKGIRKYIKNQRGQAMVEFALVLPVFLVLILGMMECGLVMHDYIVVAEAARAGARAASVGGSDAATLNAIYAAAPTIPVSQFVPTPKITGVAVGQPVTVTVTHDVPTIVSSIPNLAGGSFTILPATVTVTGTAVMRIETARTP
jgi:Flp pilus assembly protein TadG